MRITMARKGALPIALALPLTGCATSSANPNCPPPAPHLEWSPAADGGVSLSGESTARLLDYIDALERCTR